MRVKNRIPMLLSLLLCFVVLSSTILGSSVNAVFADNNAYERLPAGCKKVAETNEIALYYTTDNYGIVIEDKRNGYIWSSAYDFEKYDTGELNDLLKSRITALFDFKYTNIANKKYAIVSVDYISNKPEVKIEATKTGVNMLYVFDKLGISIPLRFSIEKNVLTVSIPVEEIKEEGDYHLISLELMPFLGACSNKEQGYIFYPDGSGAIYRFKNEPIKDITRSTFYIYGTDQVNLTEYKNNDTKGIKTAMLPVFGVKKEQNAAFLAAITEGDYDASVNFTPSGFSNIHLNRINPEFTYRRTYEDLRNDPKIPLRIETEMLKVNREVKYFFLAGDEADYSGMANEYRNYLIEKGELIRKIDESKRSIPMSLALFMGIKEQRILFDKYIKATTFTNGKTILEEFSEKGVDNIQVSLIGWGHQGYGTYPVYLPVNKKLGGEKGLKELVEYVKEKGFKLYLDANFTDATKEAGGFSIRNDTVYKKNGLIVSDENNASFLLNPVVALERFRNQFILKIEKLGIDGLCFERIGKQVYHDYNKKYPTTRSETAENWQKMLEETNMRLGSSATVGGNAYVLKYVDWLSDIPVEDSGYINTTEAIPFYQMVVHGYVPYSSSPGNLFYEYQSQKLKWVEYGCMPYFKLTYSKSDVLKYTDYNSLFSSYYKDWLDIAAETYKEFNERLGDIWSKAMVKHEQLREGIYKVVYENGTKIYINYNHVNEFIEGYEVNAVDYLVVDKEGNIR